MLKKIVVSVLATAVVGGVAVGVVKTSKCETGKSESCCANASVAPTQSTAAAQAVRPAPHTPTRCCAAEWDASERADKSVPKSERGFDPVCRRLIDRRQAVATRTENGVEFHFCSDACAAAFDKNPSDFHYCPVFKGSRVDPKISAEIDGKTYYFCCVGCRIRFMAGARGGAANDFFGMSLALDKETNGLRIDHVTPGSEADRAGFEAGMTLIGTNDDASLTSERFFETLRSVKPGETVVLRARTSAGTTKTLTITLDPPSSDAEALATEFADQAAKDAGLSDAERGAFVISVRGAVVRVVRDRKEHPSSGCGSLRKVVSAEIEKLIDTARLTAEQKRRLHEAVEAAGKPASCEKCEDKSP